MLFIVLISAAVYLISSVTGGDFVSNLLFHPPSIMRGQVWRLFTWIFVPTGGNIFFVAIALYFYYFIGSTLEREWGTAKFTVYYLFGILVNLVYGLIVWIISGSSPIVVPIYLNLSMLFAFATIFPDFTVRLFLIIPIKIKWLAWLNAAFFAFTIILGVINGQIFEALLPIVAILNYVLICGYDLMSYIRPITLQRSPQVVNFKKAAKQVKRDLADKPYRHKCAVCGKTDIDSPELEFRYCSRCNGYHCFCIEHINNHIHFE